LQRVPVLRLCMTLVGWLALTYGVLVGGAVIAFCTAPEGHEDELGFQFVKSPPGKAREAAAGLERASDTKNILGTGGSA